MMDSGCVGFIRIPPQNMKRVFGAEQTELTAHGIEGGDEKNLYHWRFNPLVPSFAEISCITSWFPPFNAKAYGVRPSMSRMWMTAPRSRRSLTTSGLRFHDAICNGDKRAWSCMLISAP